MIQAFGLLPYHLALALGKPFVLPASGGIPTATSTLQLLRGSGARCLLSVPSILEEITSLPNDEGINELKKLQFVAFSGGSIKEPTGNKLVASGVKLINHYGSTETGPLAPFHVPSPDNHWKFFKLRQDIMKPLKVQIDSVSLGDVTGDKWRLSLQPPGWPERFEIQDILLSRPHSEREYTVAGRSDDMICLATGEKVRPAVLETALCCAEGVKGAIAFGDKQFEIGVLIEPANKIDEAELDDFKKSIWPLVEKANGEMDAHGHISSTRSMVIVHPNSFPRSDKGSIIRRKVYEQFRNEIADVYQQLDTTIDSVNLLHEYHLERDLRKLIRENISWRVKDEEWTDDVDFFELGMDSLQALILRRFLAASLLLVGDSGENNRTALENIGADFVYEHPSIAKMSKALRHRITKIPKQGVSQEEEMEKLVNSFSLPRSESTTTIVLTGGTGNLGAHILSDLLRNPNVGRVVCINRPSEQDSYSRQRHALQSKKLAMSESEWSKVEVLQTNTTLPRLGLDDKDYTRLRKQATHIIHSAWPMSFKMHLSSFESQFRVLHNFLALARDAHEYNPLVKPRVLFVSSISSVGSYPNIYDEIIVPESPMRDFKSCIPLGYGQAKLVCEKIIERTREDFPEIEAGYVRVGQLAGSQNGCWNTDEHIPALVASSQKIGNLPNVKGVSFSNFYVPMSNSCC